MKTQKGKQLDHYPFDGWDFMEFSEAWNVCVPDACWCPGQKGYHPELSDADVISVYLKGVLKSHGGGDPTRVMRKCARDIRVFCEGLGNSEHSCDAPLWAGMAKIDCDWTIIRYAIKLMGSMWD